MLKNYLVVAIRNLLRHKGYSAINILGLAVGMACCILVLLFIQEEFQYDSFHKDKDRIYRVVAKIRTQDGIEGRHIGTSGPLGPAMARDLPEVEAYMRVYMVLGSMWFQTEKNVSLEKYFLTDPHFFEFFSFPLLKGNAKTVLIEPYSAVISKSMAYKYFEDENPIGQTIDIDSRSYRGTYRITGIMQDPPRQSSLQMDFVTATIAKGDATRQSETDRVWHTWHEMESWRPIWTFVRLKDGTSAQTLESKLSALVLKHNTTGRDGREIRETKPDLRYYLQPLTRMYLYSKKDYGIEAPAAASEVIQSLYGDIQRIYLLSAIALFVLAIACINFMNLTTARSAGRAREVGLRKVVGAYRSGLIQQFLSESILVALLALLLAILLAGLALPLFNGFIGKSLSLLAHGQTGWFIGLLGCTVLVGVIAGSYPAFYLSAFRPVTVLKGAFQSSKQGAWVRKGLVVLQFSISILLIIGTVVVYRQLSYLQNKELGFDKSHVVMLPIFRMQRRLVTYNRDRLALRHTTVKEAFLKHPNVESATVFRQLMGQRPGAVRVIQPEGFENAMRFYLQPVDENFIDFFNLELIAGRNFKPEEIFHYWKYYILNESAVKAFGWSDPLGKKIERDGDVGTVIGVVKDFHNGSLRNQIEPAALTPMSSLMAYVVLRIKPNRFADTVDFLKETWHQFLPTRPLTFLFLDTQLNRAYEAEQRIAKSTGVFSLIAIGLACLGLFGLAAFTTEQRTKEIGVRKVLGASVSHVIFILSKEFARLVLIANLIAWPIAYYGLNAWLQTFAYRTSLGIDAFILGGGLAILIALLTVSTLAIRASLSDPVESLRYE